MGATSRKISLDFVTEAIVNEGDSVMGREGCTNGQTSTNPWGPCRGRGAGRNKVGRQKGV